MGISVFWNNLLSRRLRRGIKWAVMGLLLYKINWLFTFSYFTLKLAAYITPKLLFYTGAAILSIT